jgi:hypothetical protein
MFRRKEPHDYLYISDAKLDQLFEQIKPPHRRHLSAVARS